MKKIKEFIRKLFTKLKPHPVIDDAVSRAIENKLAERHKEQDKHIQKYSEILNSMLRAFFSKEYGSKQDMLIAFEVSNKEWKKVCRNVNSTSKLINLNKNAFKIKVDAVLNQMAQSQCSE